jgi:hypothetical protein
MEAFGEIVQLFKDQNEQLLIELAKEFQLNRKSLLRKYHTPYYYMPVTHISSAN